MRVGIFTDNDFNKVNGVTTTLNAVLKHAPSTLDLRVYTADDVAVDTPQYLALKSRGVPIPYYSEMKMYVPRVREYIRRAQADGIDLVHLTTPGPVGLAALKVARALNVPMVGTFHTDLAAYTTILSGWPALGAVMREYMRWLYGRCEYVLVPSEATRQLLLGTRGDASRIGIWTRGVDTMAFNPVHRSEALRRQWRVSGSRPAIVYVGRVSREKGLDLLPAIERRLLELGVSHRLVIVGQGPMLDELRERLPDAVFTGVLNRQDAAVAFASSDLFVFPSRTDTAGNVVLEAQASGLPVIVSDEGGPQEQMVRDRTGIVVSGTDPNAWAYAITTLLRDRDCRIRLSGAARAHAGERSWQRALEPLYQTYRELAMSRAGGVTRFVAMPSPRVS